MTNKKKPIFTGCATALVTPFLPDGTLDEEALSSLILNQLDAGVDALVLLGTTGEPSTLSFQEREHVIRIGIAVCAGRIPLIVGTGSNCTSESIEFALQAKELGAQGQLCVTPYYNKTTQKGLIFHYEAILESCDLPVIFYNVPSRTGMSISVPVIKELALHPLSAGIKEASGDLALAADIIRQTDGKLPVYCGNDDIIAAMMAMGARGAISVCSNVVPSSVCALTHACLSGRFEKASKIQLELLPLIRALFSQVSPIPVKAALSILGRIGDILRLPLVPMEEPHRRELLDAMKKLGLIAK